MTRVAPAPTKAVNERSGAVWSSDANRSFTPEQRSEAIKRRDLGRGRGNTRGDCPPLQRPPEHHFEADGLIKRPRSPK
jgi:hypothetical protein